MLERVVYVDTSVLVALIVPEPNSAAVSRWYARTPATLASSDWCVTEFASALGIKQRTGQLTTAQAHEAWQRFQRLAANDLVLTPPPATGFERAAALTLDASSGLRAGDALHLACAEHLGAIAMATLDATLGRNARRLKIKLVALS